MAFPPNFLDEIRTRLPVSDVCGKRVKLQKRGREFVGLSPFNNEKSPSFTVNDQKGFYHCFSSGKHGDVFSFVMATEGLSFPEAVEKLARQVGMEVPQETPQERARTEKRAGLHDVMEAACKVFERSLDEPGGKAARSYLEGRGLDNDTIRGFRLGYAPQGNAMRVALEGNGITEADLLVHDAHAPEPSLAYLLSRLRHEDGFPEPIGIFRAVDVPRYDELLCAQVDAAREGRGDGDLSALLNSGDTWTVS